MYSHRHEQYLSFAHVSTIPINRCRPTHLFVSERGGKEEDKTRESSEAEDREEVAAKVLDVGCDKVGGIDRFTHNLDRDHLDRGGLLGLEGAGGGCICNW